MPVTPISRDAFNQTFLVTLASHEILPVPHLLGHKPDEIIPDRATDIHVAPASVTSTGFNLHNNTMGQLTAIFRAKVTQSEQEDHVTSVPATLHTEVYLYWYGAGPYNPM